MFFSILGLLWLTCTSCNNMHLHTPLMAVTNAISSIIILGALIQIGSTGFLITILAAAGIFMASVNIFGGFLVTRRMLAMFQKS